MARGEYYINNLYQPGYSSFKPGEIAPPNYLGKENLSAAGNLGVATNPTVANQIGELAKVLNTGTIPVEVGTLDLKNFDSIPTEYWEEMRRKADLNDARVTLHAPLIDPAGFNEQQKWDESQQKLVELQLTQIMDKAAKLTSKKNAKPVPVTIHAGNYAGSTYKYIDDPEKGRIKVADQLIAVDRASGQLAPISEETTYHIGEADFGKKHTAEYMLDVANSTQWRKEIDKVVYEKETADKVIDKIFPTIKERYIGLRVGEIKPKELEPGEIELMNKLSIGEAHLQDAHLSLNTAFEKAYKYGDEETKKKLKEISDEFGKAIGSVNEKEFNKLSKEKQREIYERKFDMQNQARAIQAASEALREYNPQLLQRVEDFSIEKASETLKNVAMHNYNNTKDYKTAPQLSLENLYQGMGFSQGEDLAKMIEKTRTEFQTALMKEKKLNSTEAKKVAEQMIGATFDVGHLNMSRKHGFTKEELAKEAAAVGKYVNKVHLTDNFGNQDTHLAPGMGNVPFELLLDALGDEGKKAVKINEIGGYTMNFGKIAYGETLAAFGSPIYSSGQGPYWSQTTGFQQSYSGGMGLTLPQVNYETFGSGFSTLPQELGGSKSQGAGGRMGGGSA